MNTIDYYNKNSNEYHVRTKDSCLNHLYHKFTNQLKEHASILDIGCGAGRDSLYFTSKGFNITGIDASDSMLKLYQENTGQSAIKISFEQINYNQKFDAAWANASLLHVDYNDLKDILVKVNKSLKDDGIFCASFLYGDKKHTNKDGRDFYYHNEASLTNYLDNIFAPKEFLVVDDSKIRSNPKNGRKWINVLATKINSN